MSTTQHTGHQGELLAAEYLEANGYTVLERNYRFDRAEIDLICFKPAATYSEGGELVFVEVKTRSRSGFASPESAVTPEKKRNIIRAAEAYLHETRLEGSPARFDVIAIVLPSGKAPKIEHFEDAFWKW